MLLVVFVAAAWPKLMDPDSLATAVYHYDLLPERWIGLVAVVLPGVELAAAAGLLFRRARAAAELLIAGLLVVFIAAASVALARGMAGIDCGCFGSGRALGVTLILEDAALLALAAYGIHASWRSTQQPRRISA
ncbi:hypothetical protein HS125_21110 [bacterium]|nr:hypothetical protein [bacterium]